MTGEVRPDTQIDDNDEICLFLFVFVYLLCHYGIKMEWKWNENARDSCFSSDISAVTRARFSLECRSVVEQRRRNERRFTGASGWRHAKRCRDCFACLP